MKLQQAQIEALQKENAKLAEKLKQATELLHSILNEIEVNEEDHE